MNESHGTLFLKDARFRMPASGRALARWISTLAWIAAAAGAAWFLLYGKNGLVWFGALLALFVLDRALRFGEADKPLAELPPHGRANLAEFITPEAINVLAEAEAKSSRGTDFDLEVMRELLKTRRVRRVLAGLGISVPEFARKIREFSETRESGSVFSEAQNLARLALAEALKAGSREIGVLDVLRALSDSQNRGFEGLLASFDLKPRVLKWGAAFAAPEKRNFRKVGGGLSVRKGIPLPPIPAER